MKAIVTLTLNPSVDGAAEAEVVARRDGAIGRAGRGEGSRHCLGLLWKLSAPSQSVIRPSLGLLVLPAANGISSLGASCESSPFCQDLRQVDLATRTGSFRRKH